MRIAGVGHAVFAATLIGMGILGLINGNFAPIWNAVPRGMPGREVLAYLCAFISLGCGTGLLLRRTVATAARALCVFLLLWLVLIKGRYILLGPGVEVNYQSAGETAVIAAAAWVLYAWFAPTWDTVQVGFAVAERGVRGARVLYALALIAFGLSHFAYLDQTAPLVPAWLPAHVFWAYFTGSTYLAAAAAILIGVYARLAAALSALQIALLTVLVWLPVILAGNVSRENWVEVGVSWTLTAAAWVIMDTYRAMPWLAVIRR